MQQNHFLSEFDVRLIRRRLLKWGRAHYKHFSWRKPEQLWHALIAEIFLQRTRAKNVVPVYQDFVRRFPTVSGLHNVTVEELEQITYPLGLRWRAPLIKRLCDYLVESEGRIPCTQQELLDLPGVGAYVASAMLSFHCGKRGVIIDANVVRWLCRIVDRPMNGETRRDKWLIELAEKVTPVRNSKEFNYAVLDFTMEICAKVPLCERCPLGAELCAYRRRVIKETSGDNDPFTVKHNGEQD